MYIEIGSRQSGKTTRMIQNILYQITILKDVYILIISANFRFYHSIKNRLNNLANENDELKEKFKRSLIFTFLNEYNYYEQYMALSLIVNDNKCKVYCDEFLYADKAQEFLLDKLENVEGFKDRLYLTTSIDSSENCKEIFDKFVKLNGNEYTEIRSAYFNKIKESWKDVKFLENV